ncbi:hypothetical protein SDC9_141996 [bioreactor metagenome]|uniref:Uncharacterized protein n=1 Tax=bioreactor metagenome TaxID=1076179 RepID=A0A645DZN5_9ZZZZ
MERGKLIFSDKPFRRQAVATLFFLFFLLLAGQLLVSGMAQEFKKSMIEHDYAVVGYLSREGVEDGRITAAFTQDKTNADIQKGASLLNTSGYSVETKNSLLPTVERFHRKYSLTVFFFLLFFSFALLCAQFYGVLHREKQLEDAARKLWRFM